MLPQGVVVMAPGVAGAVATGDVVPLPHGRGTKAWYPRGGPETAIQLVNAYSAPSR